MRGDYGEKANREKGEVEKRKVKSETVQPRKLSFAKEAAKKKRKMLSSSTDNLLKKKRKEKGEGKEGKMGGVKKEKQRRVKLVNLFNEGMVSSGQEVTFRGCKGVISNKGSILYMGEEFYTPSGFATKVCRDLGGSRSTRPNGWEVVFVDGHKMSTLRKLYKHRISPAAPLIQIEEEEVKISSEEEKELLQEENHTVSHSNITESPESSVDVPHKKSGGEEALSLDFLAQVSLLHTSLTRLDTNISPSGEEGEQEKK